MIWVVALVGMAGVINVGAEQLLTLSQLARRLPRHRNDRPVHVSTCHRWRSPGVRGVRMECIRIGGIWHTSLEAFQRFCERLTGLDSPTAQPRPPEPGGQAPAFGPAPRPDPRLDQVDRELDQRGL